MSVAPATSSSGWAPSAPRWRHWRPVWRGSLWPIGLRIAETHAAALAAALGDDLLVSCTGDGPARWLDTEETGAGDPPLPDGVATLADHVTGPSLIIRRLRQIGIVEAADGPRLQRALRPGQRLVTLGGELWRWDGLVRHEAADAAVRLQQRQRLVELQRLEAEAEAAAAGLAAGPGGGGPPAGALRRRGGRGGRGGATRRRAPWPRRSMRWSGPRARPRRSETRACRLETEGTALAQERGELESELQALDGADRRACGCRSAAGPYGGGATGSRGGRARGRGRRPATWTRRPRWHAPRTASLPTWPGPSRGRDGRSRPVARRSRRRRTRRRGARRRSPQPEPGTRRSSRRSGPP